MKQLFLQQKASTTSHKKRGSLATTAKRYSQKVHRSICIIIN
uniref:Uncharacterized protein n=1 Tax=Rhizophora mucronata TaxID=61149 RepID=A0A2P2IJT2_RHIMU